MDTSGENPKIWLVKVPGYLAEAWRDHDGGELAKLRIPTNPSQKMLMELAGPYAAELPKNFEMKPEENARMQVFKAEGKKISCKGTVDTKLDARVVATTKGKDGKLHVDENFLRITRQKKEAARLKQKANTIQYLDPRQGGRIIRPMPKMSNIKRKADKELAEKLKRSRMERDDLEKVLFALFEKEKHWRFTTLQNKLNQPGPWLKEVLNDIAVLNRNGPHLGQYELKPEYQGSANEAE